MVKIKYDFEKVLIAQLKIRLLRPIRKEKVWTKL